MTKKNLSQVYFYHFFNKKKKTDKYVILVYF